MNVKQLLRDVWGPIPRFVSSNARHAVSAVEIASGTCLTRFDSGTVANVKGWLWCWAGSLVLACLLGLAVGMVLQWG